MKLLGKSAVVTGASRGIGSAIARALAGEGARVVLFARCQGELEGLASKIAAEGGCAIAIKGDVGNDEDARACAEVARRARPFPRLGRFRWHLGPMRKRAGLFGAWLYTLAAGNVVN